ncbi:MAG: hypothetical protein LBF83_05790 [Spirochaetaceae bacterium]|nr:hypothetical protein [Spirochaetaceae bacterium]
MHEQENRLEHSGRGLDGAHNAGGGGGMAYFAVQVENSGRKGPWGPMVHALIP